MIDLFLLYAILAVQFPLSKLILAHISPLLLCSIRMILAGFFLLVMGWLTGLRSFTQSMKESIPLSQVLSAFFKATVFGIVIAHIAELWSLQYLCLGTAAFLYNLAPFFAALFSYFVFAETLTMIKCTGMILGFVGVAPIFFVVGEAAPSVGIGLPHVSMLIASGSMVYGWIYVRSLLYMGFSPVYITGLLMLCGGLCTAMVSWYFEDWSQFSWQCIEPVLVHIVILVVISNVIGYTLYAAFLNRYNNTMITLAGFIGSLWAALYGWFFFSETIPEHFFYSCLLVVLGVYLFQYDAK